MADALEARFRRVLLGLALLSNGSIARMDGNTGGGSVRYYGSDVIPTLGRGDAPHLYYGVRWTAAVDEDERHALVRQAEDELKAARISQADPTKVETRADIEERILARGEGWSAQDVSVWANCPVRWVYEARRGANRDEEWGRPVADATGLTADERRARVRELDGKGLPAKRIAFALSLPYSTVLRDLGRKAA